MAVSIGHTLGRNKSMDAIRAGKLTNIRIHGLAGNMNRPQPWETLAMALGNYTTPAWADPHHPETCAFLDFSSTCYYFGESLTEALGVDAPPIGLVHTAWGGSMIEQWLDNATIATCGNVSKGPTNQMFHDQYVMPYVDMALKGFVWYQGENDMHTFFGNSLAGTGYVRLDASVHCLMSQLTFTMMLIKSSSTLDDVADITVCACVWAGLPYGKARVAVALPMVGDRWNHRSFGAVWVGDSPRHW